MINQNCHEFKEWMEYQATNPPKITGFLERMKNGSLLGRCCLGNACYVSIPETRDLIDGGAVLYGEIGASCKLPPELVEVLNIYSHGNFTDRGSKFVHIYLRENNIERTIPHMYCNLTNVNDYTNADHATIGQLIEHLAFIEREYGIECFVPFN